MDTSFSGFTPQTQEFLWNVRLNNSREWFNPRKEEYQDCLARPLRLLGEEVYRSLAPHGASTPLLLHVSRIYRDTRRLFGRGPLKDNLWFTLHAPAEEAREEPPAFFFGVSPECCTLGLGYYGPVPQVMARLRAQVDRDPGPLSALVTALAARQDYCLEGEQFKRPKGDPGPLLAPWYNRRNVALCRELPWEGPVFTPRLADLVAEDFRFLLPVFHYLHALSNQAEPG